MIIDKQLYVVEQFEQFMQQPENRDCLFELVHGEIREKVVTQEHGIIVMNIGSEIRVWVKPRKLGRVGTEISHRSPGDRYNDRRPDVSFTAGVDEPVVTEGSMQRMPDLAVEVKSPGNTQRQLREKAEYLLQNGSRIVWLVYPVSRTVEVCTLTDSGTVPGAMQIQTLDENGTLHGGDVLPGFTLAIRDIFDLG